MTFLRRRNVTPPLTLTGSGIVAGSGRLGRWPSPPLWGLGIVAVLSVVLGGVWWDLQRRATTVFQRYDEDARRRIQELRGRTWVRPRLYSPTRTGDGWPVLIDALNGFDAIPASDADEFPSLNGDPDFIPDLETVEELFEKYAPLVEKLRELNRRAEFRPG